MRSWKKRQGGWLEAELGEPARAEGELVHRLELVFDEVGRDAPSRFVPDCVGGSDCRPACSPPLPSFGGSALRPPRPRGLTRRPPFGMHGVTVVHKTAARDQYGKPKAKKCVKGTRRVGNTNRCKKIKKAKGVTFGRPPSPARHREPRNGRGGPRAAPLRCHLKGSWRDESFTGFDGHAAPSARRGPRLGRGRRRGPRPEAATHLAGPTPRDGSAITVAAGRPLTLNLAAAAARRPARSIGNRGSRQGPTFHPRYGRPRGLRPDGLQPKTRSANT